MGVKYNITKGGDCVANVLCVSANLKELNEKATSKVWSLQSLLSKWTTVVEETVRKDTMQNMRLVNVLPVRYVAGTLEEAILIFVPKEES
ncbi:hypothetical protein KJA15_03635 [Patescibacteria group bacterium]|nr:hypothetical protein [Patescibacteria group bacterium]